MEGSDYFGCSLYCWLWLVRLLYVVLLSVVGRLVVLSPVRRVWLTDTVCAHCSLAALWAGRGRFIHAERTRTRSSFISLPSPHLRARYPSACRYSLPNMDTQLLPSACACMRALTETPTAQLTVHRPTSATCPRPHVACVTRFAL